VPAGFSDVYTYTYKAEEAEQAEVAAIGGLGALMMM
jgi:hypothetical protein